MGKQKKTEAKVRNRGLKDKDIERMVELQQRHPGEITPEELAERTKLEDRLERFGKF